MSCIVGPILAGIVALPGIGTVGVVAARSLAEGPHLVPIGGQLPGLAALAALAGAIAVLLLVRRIERRRRTQGDRPAPAHRATPRGLSAADLEALLTRARAARPRRPMQTETRTGGANWVRRLDDRIPVLTMGGTPDDASGDPTPLPGRPEDEPQPLARG
jgi:hypothetical protein